MEAQQPVQELQRGSVIKERYLITDFIGQGVSSLVYKATDQKLASLPVALKVFDHAFTCSPEFARIYNQEITANYQINHENVARIYDMLKSDKIVALVMEYIAGETLDQYQTSQGGRINASKARQIMSQIARGLEAIHGNSIIHCDLKPQNIIISEHNGVKITDFGVSRPAMEMLSTKIRQWGPEEIAEQKTVGMKGNSSIAGTPYYFAPEVLAKGKFDARADLHALGIIGYELLTGRNLFNFDSIYDLFHMKTNLDATTLKSSFPKSCPDELVAIIIKLLELDPEKRYATARDLRVALDDLKLPHCLLNEVQVKKVQAPNKNALNVLNDSVIGTAKKSVSSVFETIFAFPIIIFQAIASFIQYVFGTSFIIYPLGVFVIYLFVMETSMREWIQELIERLK